MKKIHKRALSVLTATIMLTAALTGCSQKSDSDKDSSPKSSSKNLTSSVEEKLTGLPMVNGKYDPPVELTTVRSYDDSVKFKNGETIDDNVFVEWLYENYGIKLVNLWTTPTTNNAFQTKLLLTLTANEPLPDFISLPGASAHDMIESKKFREVGTLFNQYACDRWKKAMEEVPSAWTPYVREEERFAIPEIDYILQHDDSMWMRKDWLDKLNLKAPTTIDELEVVMDAFVNQDPDGNGVKDTYGVTASMKNQYNAWMGIGNIFGAYGAIPHRWQKDSNGEVSYGSVIPEMKDGLARIKSWIDKGYVNKEIGLHDEMQASALFTSGKAGIAFGPTWLHDWPLIEVEVNVPGAEVWPYALPYGPNGKLLQAGEGTHYKATLFNKDFKNPEIFFTYMNALYDNIDDPVAGGAYEYGMIKGYDYDIVDGSPVYTEEEIPGGFINVQKFFPTLPPRTPSMLIGILADLANGKTPETPREKTSAKASKPQLLEAAKIVVAQKDSVMEDIFVGKPTKTMEDKMANLKKMEMEELSKILYGKIELDAGFDKFVADWNANGGDVITKEVREWYASVGGE